MPARRLARAANDEAGFTYLELIVAAIILVIIVKLMLPSYLGARNQAAIAEGNAIGKEWATLMYSCYEQNVFPATTSTAGINCFTNTVIGFTEPNGKYWKFTTGAGTSPTIASATTTATGFSAMVSFPSENAGLETGETFTVTVFLTGTNRDTVTTKCIPNTC